MACPLFFGSRYPEAGFGESRGAAVDQKGEKGEAGFEAMRLSWLEAFVRTARSKKRTAAAAEMGVSQATVTKHIQKLERWLSGGLYRPLVADNVWPVQLTEAGEDFLPVAEQILDLLRTAREGPDKVVTIKSPISAKDIKVPKL